METNALMGMNVAQLVADDFVELLEETKGFVGKEAQVPIQLV